MYHRRAGGLNAPQAATHLATWYEPTPWALAKEYHGKNYYFDGGRGKTDQDAYKAALSEWEKKKVEIDEAAPKPNQAEYERAISKWEQVLAWCREHDEDRMALVADEKLRRLRSGLAAPKPNPVQVADTFDGQFDLAVRYPAWERSITELSKFTSARMGTHGQESEEENASRLEKYPERVHRGMRTVVVPAKNVVDGYDSLEVERQVWKDRLEVMQRSSLSPDVSIKAQVGAYIKAKSEEADSGEISIGRVETVRLHLTHFAEWMGMETAATKLDSNLLREYRTSLLECVRAGKWSRTTAAERMGTLKSFVRWLWQMEVIPNLPRVLSTKSKALEIGKSRSKIITYTTDEIRRLLRHSSDRTRLFVLLMLNCGMTQKDIADLHPSEVDWQQGRITRKRSKTRHHDNVPTVSYQLWPETFALLCREREAAKSDRVLLNENGSPLWVEKRGDDRKYKKNDNIRTAFERLRQKLKIKKSLKSLKKTSASLIGDSGYTGLEGLFLGHAPQKMSEKHYAKPPQELLDEAVDWLRRQYKTNTCLTRSGEVKRQAKSTSKSPKKAL